MGRQSRGWGGGGGGDVACERRRISGCRLSPPKNNVCELEPENDFRDVESFVFSLANQITR